MFRKILVGCGGLAVIGFLLLVILVLLMPTGSQDQQVEEVAVGEPFTVAGFEWTVNDVRVLDERPEPPVYAGGTADGSFAQLNAEVVNTTDDYERADENAEMILYTNETSVEMDNIDVMIDEDANIFGGDIAPGAGREGVAVQPLEEGETPLHLEWENSSGDVLARLELDS